MGENMFTYDCPLNSKVDLSDDEQFVRNMPCYR